MLTVHPETEAPSLYGNVIGQRSLETKIGAPFGHTFATNSCHCDYTQLLLGFKVVSVLLVKNYR